MRSDGKPADCHGATSKSGFSTIQASFCTQHPSNALKLFIYHLTTWYKFMMENAFPIKKHTQHHLDLWGTHSSFFWSRRPFLHPLQRLHLGLNIIPINSRLISCYDFLKKVFFSICTGKQFLTDFNMVLFLIISQQMQHEFCTDAMHLNFFQSKFGGKILCWCPLHQQLLRQLNDDFHESQHKLSRYGRRLLMWKVVQAWDLHRLTFCPL